MRWSTLLSLVCDGQEKHIGDGAVAHTVGAPGSAATQLHPACRQCVLPDWLQPTNKHVGRYFTNMTFGILTSKYQMSVLYVGPETSRRLMSCFQNKRCRTFTGQEHCSICTSREHTCTRGVYVCEAHGGCAVQRVRRLTGHSGTGALVGGTRQKHSQTRVAKANAALLLHC